MCELVNQMTNKDYQKEKIIDEKILNLSLCDLTEDQSINNYLSSSVLEYKMTKCTSKWTTFFILTYIPNYIQNDL